MPSVIITLTDTPTGGVAIKTDFTPAVGLPISPAQAHALEIFNRTRHQWGLPVRADADKQRSQLCSAMESNQ